MPTKPTSIILIVADDLGHGMLGCYGQRHFRTPGFDRLAQEGMRFIASYGTPFCATARATLLTGIHDAHAGRWTFNRAGLYHQLTDGALTMEEIQELISNTGIQPREGQLFLASACQRAGYATAQVGKLEWGFVTSDADIRSHGWDHHYGYYDHLHCHGFYPPYIFEDGRRIDIPGNTRRDFGAGQYSPFTDGAVAHDPAGRAVHCQDLYDEKMVAFLRAHQDRPFLLYHPSQLPHGPVYLPDHAPEVRDHPALTPVEREFASMVLRLDRTVSLLLETLDELGLGEQTLVLFTSDNGHYPTYIQPGRVDGERDLQGTRLDQLHTAFRTATCGDVFNGNGGLAGLKATNWEGGARVPYLARWTGHIAPGAVSDRLITHYDALATLAELVGTQLPRGATDGISYLPALLGRTAEPHEDIVYASYLGPSLVSSDGWKLRTFLRRDRIVDFSTFGTDMSELREAIAWQLYHLPSDPQELTDRSASEPARLHALQRRLLRRCDGNLVHGIPEAHFAFFPEFLR